VALCMVIKRHYSGVFAASRPRSDPHRLPPARRQKSPATEEEATAVLLVGGFSGLGIHSLLTVIKLFPRYFANVVFMSVGVVDSATFQGVEEVDRVRDETEEALKKYVDLAADGIPADQKMSMGTEAVSECERLAAEVAKEYERSIFFAGKLIFEREKWWTALAQRDRVPDPAAPAVQGLPMVVLPVRVLEE